MSESDCFAGWIVRSGSDLLYTSDEMTITDAFRDALDRQLPTTLGQIVEFTPRYSVKSTGDTVYALTERLLRKLGRWGERDGE